MKTKARKFYRTEFTIIVLSEEPVPAGIKLSRLEYEITDGAWSGDFSTTGSKEVTGKEMAKMLQEQASDPSFFNLTEDGKDADAQR